jgi:NifU-like protein
MWERYSKKIKEKIQNPLFEGSLQKAGEGMRLIDAFAGSFAFGAKLRLYLIIDETDGVIVDGAYEWFGPPLFGAICDVGCELLMRKTYLQASRLSGDLIENHAKESKEKAPFPSSAHPLINLFLLALDDIVQRCDDIPTSQEALTTPFSMQQGEEITKPDNWEELAKEEKIAFIDQLLTSEVRPYIELDEGGVTIIDLEDNDLIISYQGACTSCYAATGSTLTAIQQIIQTKVDPNINVIPKM